MKIDRRSARRSIAIVILPLTMVAMFAGPSAAYERPGVTIPINVLPDGKTQPGAPDVPLGQTGYEASSVSDGGRFVAFHSQSPDLVPGDTNRTADIFLRDLAASRTERISVTPSGAQAEGLCVSTAPVSTGSGSWRPSITPSGRYIAFASCATNLVPGDTNLAMDVFVFDRRRGSAERVSISSSGEESSMRQPGRRCGGIVNDYPGSRIGYHSISDNGRFVVLESDADNLVPDDTNGALDVFVFDRAKRSIERANLGSTGQQENVACPESTTAGHFGSYITISPDGGFVGFWSNDNGLVPGDANGGPSGLGDVHDAFIRDMKAKDTELVSVGSDGTQQSSPHISFNGKAGIAISQGGRYVAFHSDRVGLVPNDSRVSDAFVRDRVRKRTERVTVSWVGEQVGTGGQVPWEVSISNDGRFVTFGDSALLAPPVGTGCDPQEPTAAGCATTTPLVHDRLTGSTSRLNADLGDLNGGYGEPLGIDSTGRYASFTGRCAQGGACWATWMHDRGPSLGGVLAKGDSDRQNQNEGAGASLEPRRVIDQLDLQRSWIAHRAEHDDLYAGIEVGHMARVLAGPSPLFYGVRFQVDERTYEARATAMSGGTFALFECSGSPICTKVGDLHGGYGTTGMRIVVSIPTALVGLDDVDHLRNVLAFSGVGSWYPGAGKIVDTLRLI